MCAALRRSPDALPSSRRYTRSFGPIELYLSDLDALVQFLRERAKSVQLHAGGATADDAYDMREATRRELKSVRLVTSEPFIAISFSRVGAAAATFGDDKDGKRLVDDVAQLMQSHESLKAALKVSLRYAGPALPIGAVLGTAISLSVQTQGTLLSLFMRNIAGAAAATALAVLIILLDVRRIGSAVVIPQTRADARGNSRQSWVIALVTLIVSSIVAFAAAYYQVRAQQGR